MTTRLICKMRPPSNIPQSFVGNEGLLMYINGDLLYIKWNKPWLRLDPETQRCVNCGSSRTVEVYLLGIYQWNTYTTWLQQLWAYIYSWWWL